MCLEPLRLGSKAQQKTETRDGMMCAHANEKDLSGLCLAKAMRRY